MPQYNGVNVQQRPKFQSAKRFYDSYWFPRFKALTSLWWSFQTGCETTICGAVANTENFHGEISFSGIWWSVVFGVRCLWRHDLTSYFQAIVLAKIVDIICIFFYTYTHSPYFMCHCTEYKVSALQLRISEEKKLNATTQEFITAKILGCALKQGSKTHS